jgi:hypothetical protein
LIWMLGALLGLMVPWTLMPLAMTFVLLAATGFASRALARVLLNDSAATLAGCAAIFSGYALSTAYLRAAYAELSGGFWIPLLLLYALRSRKWDLQRVTIFRRAFHGSALPLALIVAGAWLSNAPLGVMSCYLLACVALISAIQSRSVAPILRAAAATVLGIAATAVYLIPAIEEQSWVAIRHAVDDSGKRIEQNWIFERLNDPAIWWHDGEIWKASMVTVSMVGIALTCCLIAYRRGALGLDSQERRRWYLPLFLIPIVALFLQFPISHFLWNELPKLRFLQFPWRWLIVVESPMAIFMAAAVWSFGSRWRPALIALCGMFFVFSIGLTMHSFFVACTLNRSLPSLLASYASGQGIRGVPEYLPANTDPDLLAKDLLAPGLPASCLTNDLSTPLKDLRCDQQFPLTAASGPGGHERFSLTGTSSHSGYLVLHVLGFPGWRATVNGQETNLLPSRSDGLIALPVPQGQIAVELNWTTTSDVILGRWISCVAFLLLGALWLTERKLALAHLSSEGCLWNSNPT